MAQFIFEIGTSATDIISGKTGVIVGRAEHITGCNTYGLHCKDAETATWYDEQRLKANPKAKRVVIDNTASRNGSTGTPRSTRGVA